MLITRAGSSSPLAASRVGRRNFVRWKTPFTLRSSTRLHAASSNSSSGVPQVAPALFTRMWSTGSRSAIWPASVRHPSSVERLAGIASQGPMVDSSAATFSQTSALREEM